jgi:hypothetical protein
MRIAGDHGANLVAYVGRDTLKKLDSVFNAIYYLAQFSFAQRGVAPESI